MNSQSCSIAWPPDRRAGPKLRAGLTETPVTWMPTMWMTARVMPMATPANGPWAFSPVTPRMATTKMAVMTNSKIRAAVMPYPPR